MGISRLNIRGFRSLRDVTWEPGRLNVLIGPNGSGKSNLLRALMLLQKAVQGELPEAILRAGGISPLLWDGQVSELSWSARVDPPLDRRRESEALSYELGLRQLGSGSSYRIERELLAELPLQATGEVRKFLERTPQRAVFFDPPERWVTAQRDDLPDDQTLLSLIAGPFGNPVLTGFRTVVDGWAVHHDMRVDPGAEVRQAAVARVEHRVNADGQNLIPVLHTFYTGSREFKRSIDDAMRVAFSGDYEELVFPPAADQRVQLRVRWRTLRSEQTMADLSDGTIRFLMLLAILNAPSPGEMIAIDEPETGLHPSMLPIIAEHAAEAATRTQVVLTTHSTQLLDALTEFQPTTTVAHWRDGMSSLAVVDREELARWLKDYSLGALFRTGELEGMA